jgi:hypothetical protein
VIIDKYEVDADALLRTESFVTPPVNVPNR